MELKALVVQFEQQPHMVAVNPQWNWKYIADYADWRENFKFGLILNGIERTRKRRN